MNYNDFTGLYPEKTVTDFVDYDVEDLTEEEVRKAFGVPESEFAQMLEQHLEASDEWAAIFTHYDETAYSPFEPVLPQKFYTVRVLGFRDVTRDAVKRFASLYPEEFKAGKFWYPSFSRVYRSLSGARARADLLDFYGVECEVVETATDWRKHETKKEYVERLERENAEMRKELGR